MAQTIPIPTADQAQKIAVNKTAKRHSSVVVPVDQKLAVVLLHLNPAVTPADYPALGTAINAVTGITGVNLLIDGQTPATIPADHELRVIFDAQLRIEPLPEEEP